MFQTVAPFVDAGSFIQMVDESGGVWRWVFDGTTLQEVSELQMPEDELWAVMHEDAPEPPPKVWTRRSQRSRWEDPCPKCLKAPVDFEGAEQCANCWEVERRIDDFLVSARNREFIRGRMARAGG